MHPAKLSWISPKGYGLALLDNGEKAFIPAHVVQEFKKEEQVEEQHPIEERHQEERFLVSLEDGCIGRVVTKINPI